MTHVISAFPCLGKTTIYQLNKTCIFDREFNESRSQLGMNIEERIMFSNLCAKILNLQIESKYHDYIFVTDDKSIVSKININIIKNGMTFIFPNIFDKNDMKEYKKRVINRSGNEWYERVIIPRLDNIADLIFEYQKQGFDVRFTTASKPYIEDVFKFSDNIVLPRKNKG